MNTAIAIYRTEKAKSDERNAAKRAELHAKIAAALARADADVQSQRGGRPRKDGQPIRRKHGPNITVSSSDPLDLLRRSRP